MAVPVVTAVPRDKTERMIGTHGEMAVAVEQKVKVVLEEIY